MDKMYKNMTGWHPADDKHSATHMLLTIDEYNDLLIQRDKALMEQKRMEGSMQQYRADLDKAAQEAVDKANQVNAKLRETLADAKHKIEYEQNLNKNLLRINKERSNAERHLQPKKKHTGYVVMQSQQRDVRYATGRKTAVYTAWETVIQSPYTVDLPAVQAKTQIQRDLMPAGGDWPICAIGIEGYCYADLGKVLTVQERKDVNTIYNAHYRANYKTGYWDVIYLHTQTLGPVPKEMRP